MTKHFVTLAVVIAAVLSTGSVSAKDGDAEAATKPVTLTRPAHFALVDAAPSVDVLIDRLLDALARNDARAMHRLRVTENEYRKFFLPGSVKPGESARVYDDESSKFYWELINSHNLYAVSGIIKKYGGHRCHVKERQYLKGQETYAWYEAYKTLHLVLEDENGKQAELTLGSIADVDGQFKFISLLGKS
jgi:hypothetical protein